jgi:hypothetical protein
MRVASELNRLGIPTKRGSRWHAQQIKDIERLTDSPSDRVPLRVP